MIDDNIEPSGNEEASQETGLLDSASVETEAVESNPQKTEISHLEASDEDDDSPLERPDWWPENFWKRDDAEPDLQAMAKSWGDLRKQISQGKHKAPADGNYDVAAFKDIPAEDPVRNHVLSWAKEYGVSQAALDNLVGKVVFSYCTAIENNSYLCEKLFVGLGR